MAKKSKQLEEIAQAFEEIEKIDEKEIEKLPIDVEFVQSIKDNAIYIVDQRDTDYVLHSVESIVLTLIFAMLANCNTFVQIMIFLCAHYEWLNKHINYDNGIPSISTIKRVISFINPKELEKVCLTSLVNYIKRTKPIYKDEDITVKDIKTMDGKTANSSDRANSKNGEAAKTNAMSILSVKNDYCEATEFIDKKTNEIPTGPKLLKKVNIKNCLITFDAMSTQTETIKYIVKHKGFYVAPVKGNQSTLENDIKTYFEDQDLYEKAKKDGYLKIEEYTHGTFEKREYIFTNDIDWLDSKDDWLGLKSIGLAKRTYEKNGKEIEDIRYYISNLNGSKIKLISDGIRGEWSIENKLHYYLDMVFCEDNNTCFVGNTQKNLNIIRKFALFILKSYRETMKPPFNSINSVRFQIANNFEKFIEEVINNLCA